MADTSKYVIAIVGPTAVGKTSITIDLAKEFKAQIVSADSRQFYREMTIGTAKPSERELDDVPHHFINSHFVVNEFSAGKYEQEALELIEHLHQSNNIVFLTGGSGLYINALLNGLPDIPDVPSEIRTKLNNELEEGGLQPLLNELEKVDPTYYNQVDQSNPLRVIRGLEIYRFTGESFSSFRSNEPKLRSFKTIKIGLNRERSELYNRIDKRVDVMISQGLIEEVEGLIEYKNHQALQTVGYKEVFDYLDGQTSKEEAIELIKRNTRRYAKRQLTWFRKDQDISWFQTNEKARVIDFIHSKIKS